ncbi:MAG: MATE family efflux transporter [Lachnospiraceae bacterium]|nr:MATE family efflux transporter [Lachnospiraceae bacterium]
MKLYDKKQIDWNNLLFDNKTLCRLILPIVIEQFLNSLMGMADTMMVSTVGSEAISAVALVDSINNLVIQIFSALAAGAAIVCSRYIGSGNKKESSRAAGQVVLTVFVISLSITFFCIAGGERLLRLIFGTVEDSVMENALFYFMITVISYPFLGLFSAGAAFYRASGNSKFPTKVSVVSNMINVTGNALFIYGFQWGVMGAALATLFSRVFSTVVIYYCLRKPGQTIIVRDYFKIRPDMKLILAIMAIGVPAGIENGMFQFGKLAVQSTVSTMGTVAISAQAMTDILELVNGIFSNSVGIGLMTVAGQCIGARSRMCFEMVAAMTVVKPLVWVGAFGLPYGFRAAGDAKFSMVVSVSSMWCCRVGLCIFLVRVFHFGLMGVWIGIFVDWIVRAFIFSMRFMSGKWLRGEMPDSSS